MEYFASKSIIIGYWFIIFSLTPFIWSSNLSLSGMFSLIRGTSMKFWAQACNRGSVLGSRTFTPTISSMAASQQVKSPYEMSTRFMLSPPKNFLSPRPCSSKTLNTSTTSFTAFSSSSPLARKRATKAAL